MADDAGDMASFLASQLPEVFQFYQVTVKGREGRMKTTYEPNKDRSTIDTDYGPLL